MPGAIARLEIPSSGRGFLRRRCVFIEGRFRAGDLRRKVHESTQAGAGAFTPPLGSAGAPAPRDPRRVRHVDVIETKRISGNTLKRNTLDQTVSTRRKLSRPIRSVLELIWRWTERPPYQHCGSWNACDVQWPPMCTVPSAHAACWNPGYGLCQMRSAPLRSGDQ